ncbi:hypothetical protein, partial [Chitinimonas sp.]|uniref:hypothetical protein n=1 Tax=Chitinimonas sp. TaxID=1934313 RepID=UPI0035AD91F2
VALLQQYAGQGWRATGQSFKAWQPGTAGTQPVCRYYRANGSSLLDGGDALFYASQPELCALGQSLAPTWQALGAPIALASPEANGRCAPGSQLINRAMRVGSKPGELNFRFSTSESEVRLLQQQGWQIDGSAMCAPL